MEKDSIFPAIWTRKAQNRYISTAGMKLESIMSVGQVKAQPPISLPGFQQNMPETEWDFSRKLVQTLLSWGQNTFTEIHWVSSPNLESPARGSIGLTLTLNSFADSSARAKEEVLTHYLPFRGVLFTLLPEAVFTPIRNQEVLRQRVEPFPLRHSCALVRRNEPISLSLPLQVYPSHIGFLTREDVRNLEHEGPGQVEHLFPWSSSGDSLHSLVTYLLWYPEPVKLQFRLQLFLNPEKEKENLLREIQSCQDILEKSVASGQAVLLTQAEMLRDFLTRRLRELGQGMAQVSAHISSRRELDETLLQMVAQGFISCNPGNDPAALLQGGASIKKVNEKQIRDLDFSPDERAFSIAEAACFFRIPSPPEKPLPGLPVRRWRSDFADLPKIRIIPGDAILGKNSHRGVTQPVHVRAEDRMRHMYIFGQTGTGKSTFMESLILQDIEADRGVCVMDPQGELVDSILLHFPTRRGEDLVLIDLTDLNYPFALNLLKWETPDERDRIVDELYFAIDQLYDLMKTGGPVFERHFRGMLRVLMGQGKHKFIPTLLDFPRLYTDKAFRNLCRKGIDDEETLVFLDEVEKIGGDASMANISLYITSKFARFIQDSRLVRILGQERLSLNFSEAMDNGKVVLITLGKGAFGETVSSLVASQLVGRFKAAAMARAKIAPEKRQDFFLYVDEFQNLAHENFADLLSESRKYRLGLILANQYVGQLKKEWIRRGDTMLSSILGNVGMVLAFRLGVEDARQLQDVFAPSFSAHDLIELPNWEGYLKIHLGGRNIPAFNIQTVKKQRAQDPERAFSLRELSRKRYCRPAKEVDEEIKERSKRLRQLASGED